MKERIVPLNLDNIIDREAQLAFPLVLELVITEEPPPTTADNLRKMQRLGILNADALLALVAQAPIDPVNLMGTLMRLLPDGWAFSAIDFSMMRVLARDGKKTVAAAMHVDLLGGDKIKFLARNRAGQLVEYKEYVVQPSAETWDTVQALITETIAAAEREAKP